MKKFALLTVLATLGLLGFSATNVLAVGGVATNKLEIKIVALVQTNDVVHGNTTIYRAMKFKITTKDLLNLLAEEFNTNFPDGARLGEVYGDISVLDKNGNLFLDVASNPNDDTYSLYFGYEGSGIEVGKDTVTSTKSSANYTYREYSFLSMSNSNTDIHFDGMGTENYSSSYNNSTHAYKASYFMSLPGAGYASFNNGGIEVTLTGAITGHGKQSGIAVP